MIPGIVASQTVASAPAGPVYATFDPSNTHSDIVLSAGNLTATKFGLDALRSTRSTLSVSSGKHYCELLLVESGFNAPYALVGVGTAGVSLASSVGGNASGWSYYEETGQKYTNNAPAAYGSAWTADGDRIGIALDMDAGRVWFSKNGVWQASGDPVEGTTPAFSGLTGPLYIFASLYRASGGQAHQFVANFGASAFAYPVPIGFRSGLYQ